MSFNSLQYFVFLGVVVAAYWRLGVRAQNLLLLAVSYLFYAAWDWRFLSLIMVSTAIDFAVGRRLGRTEDDGRRTRLLLVSLAANLGILGYFKYAGFFVDSGVELFHAIGLDLDAQVARVALPVGISFYTFQTISYTFDIYRRRLEPTDDLLAFAVFVAFFPQLVAGPIERARRLLPQLQRPRTRPDREGIDHALFMILTGLFKKVVIADSLAVVVDIVYRSPDEYHWVVLMAANLAFVAQIYGDFSGYTDIARGSARLLGVDLSQNFRQPFLSRNINEWWTRWHITLSTWFLDYVYVPLGGSRGGHARTSINLILTMTLAGLWHGAFWPMVMWGTANGVWMAAHRYWASGRGGFDTERPLLVTDVPFMIATAGFQAFLAPLFRVQGWDGAVGYMARVAGLSGGAFDTDLVLRVVVILAGMVALDLVSRRTRRPRAELTWKPALTGSTVGLMAAVILVHSGGSPVQFIYFQF